MPCIALAGSKIATVGWDPSVGAAGYELYYGTASGDYNYVVDVGSTNSCSISGLVEGTTYYFAAKAYNSEGVKSELSSELKYTIPVTNPDDFKLWIEAEEGDLFKSFSSAEDSTASGKYFVWTPQGTGNYWNPSSNAGYAEYSFDVPQAGNYVIWGRVIADSGTEDSFFVKIDSGNYALWDVQQSGSWKWDKVKDRDGADPVVYYLEAGEHTLTIMQREDGTKIDQILITNDLSYIPEQSGDNPPSVSIPQNSQLFLEAENGTLTSPFKTASDSNASSGQYGWVPNGWGSVKEPENSNGGVVFTFNVPAAGDYAVWARVLAPNSRDNSFFTAVDGGALTAWHIPSSTSWKWREISAVGSVVYLKAGTHTLTINQREDGTKIDQVLITGDLDYTPE